MMCSAPSAKKAEARARHAKALLLARMGAARTASHGGITIARRQPTQGDSIALYAVAKTL